MIKLIKIILLSLSLFSVLVGLISCDPDPIDIDPPIPPIDTMDVDTIACPNYESDFFNVIWQTPLHFDTLLSRSIVPQIVDDIVVFSDRFADNNENLKAFDKSDGNFLWITDDFDPNNQGIKSKHSNYIYENLMCFNFSKKSYCVNLNNGNLHWESVMDNGNPRTTIISNYLYQSQNSMGGEATLLRTRINAPEWENVYSMPVVFGYSPSLESPSLYLKNGIDSVLMIQNRAVNWSTNELKVDLMAYNLTLQQLEWQILDITEDGNSSVFPPIIYQDKVYFQGASSIHCFDAKNGNEIWKREFENDFFLWGSNIIFENKLIANSSTREIFALDLETGNTIWNNPDTGSTVENMATYDSHIYFGSGGTGKLYKINANNGVKVWESRPPNIECTSDASFVGGVAIDQESGYLYTQDQFFAMCIDLNN